MDSARYIISYKARNDIRRNGIVDTNIFLYDSIEAQFQSVMYSSYYYDDESLCVFQQILNYLRTNIGEQTCLPRSSTSVFHKMDAEPSVELSLSSTETNREN